MDPRKILGVELSAGDDEIRAAYLQRIKDHPPEQSPEQFEKIRDAYEILRDPRWRMRDMLLSADPDAPFASLLEGQVAPRRFAGPGAWLEVLRGK